MPAKKHPSARARANRATTAATLTVATGVAPDLPPRPAEVVDGKTVRSWHRETKAWWADIWASPMSNEYHESDRHGLFVLAVLIDQFWRAPDTKLASEIRLQRVAFGMTPYDRRRLEWTIESAEESKDRGQARRERAGTKQPAAKTDPRLALVN